MRQGPSGTAKRNPTEKEQWICANFGFLVDHITRIPSRQGSNVLSKRLAKDNSSSGAEEFGPLEISDDPDISMDIPPAPAKRSKGGPYKKRRQEPQEEPHQQRRMDELMELARSSTGALQASFHQMAPPPPPRHPADLHERRIRAMGDYIVAECLMMDTDTFDEFHTQLMPMIFQLKGNLMRTKRQQQQPQQQHHQQHHQHQFPKPSKLFSIFVQKIIIF